MTTHRIAQACEAAARLSALIEEIDRAADDARWEDVTTLGRQVQDAATLIDVGNLELDAPDVAQMRAMLSEVLEQVAALSKRVDAKRRTLVHDLGENRLRSKVNSAYGPMSNRT